MRSSFGEPARDLLGDSTRFAAEHLGQRHGAIGLVVAELGILRLLDHGGIRRWIIDEATENRSKARLQKLRKTHESDILALLDLPV